MNAQSRADLEARFGPPRIEIFALPHNIRLTAAFNAVERVCMYRIETAAHLERGASSLSDGRYWMDSAEVTKLIAQLVPASSRRGIVDSQRVGLREGEDAVIESDDTVQITRTQRTRRVVAAPEIPVADRLVKIVYKGRECERPTSSDPAGAGADDDMRIGGLNENHGPHQVSIPLRLDR